MSNEMLQKTIDLVSSLEVKNETQQIVKYELIEYTERLHKENQKLKKQLTKKDELIKDLSFAVDDLEKHYKTHQKKFIEYLENEIKYWEEQEQQWIKLGFMKFGGEANNKIIFKKVLSKYKEIIGVKDE